MRQHSIAAACLGYWPGGRGWYRLSFKGVVSGYPGRGLRLDRSSSILVGSFE